MSWSCFNGQNEPCDCNRPRAAPVPAPVTTKPISYRGVCYRLFIALRKWHKESSHAAD